MKLKKKPEKPERKTIVLSFEVSNGPFSDVINYFQDVIRAYDPGHYFDVTQLYIGYGGDWDYSKHFKYEILESTEDYDKVLTKYEEELLGYKKWYKANKKEIEKELADRAHKRKTLTEKRKQAKKERLEKEFNYIKKELEKL